MSKVISIIKEKHLGTFKYSDDCGLSGHCLRLCKYKVFYDDDYGRIGVCSAIDDLYLTQTVFPFEADIKPLYCKIDMRLLESFIENEKKFSGNKEHEVVTNTILDMVVELPRYAEQDVLDYLKEKGRI